MTAASAPCCISRASSRVRARDVCVVVCVRRVCGGVRARRVCGVRAAPRAAHGGSPLQVDVIVHDALDSEFGGFHLMLGCADAVIYGLRRCPC